MRSIRLILLTLVGLLVISAALPLVAAEDEPAPADPVETDYEPAVIFEPAADGEIEPDWTTKFLVPTGLLIAAIALLSTVVMYFVRVVRTRYKVVE